jgi:hypothetical protein
MIQFKHISIHVYRTSMCSTWYLFDEITKFLDKNFFLKFFSQFSCWKPYQMCNSTKWPQTTIYAYFPFNKAISCFFSVLRQFKIVKPTLKPGEKTNKLWKKNASACCLGMKHNKNQSISFISQKKFSTKCKIEDNE